MKPAVEINQLGKKYQIKKTDRYLALRDTIASSLKNIFKRTSSDKKDFWALQDINLKIEPGERLGIIGKNGAGKSTLLKLLSRVTYPTTGEAIIRGRLASLLEVGTGFHPELTGRENIYLNGSILGLKKTEIKRQFDAIVDFSGVELFLDTALKNYSSGMQLRMAFAVAAHLEPEILLIDEVLAVGDMEFQKKCISKMEEISTKDGRTILFVSHQLNSLIKLCNRAVWLETGKIEHTGLVSETIEYYTKSLKSEPTTTVYKKGLFSMDHFFSSIEVITPHINVGGDVVLLICFNEKYTNQQLVLNINVLDEGGDLLSHIINEDDNFSIKDVKNNSIIVNLKQLNLLPGRYYISCWAGFDMTHGIEKIEKAVAFEINELNEFTHRLTAFPSNSKVIIRSIWKAG